MTDDECRQIYNDAMELPNRNAVSVMRYIVAAHTEKLLAGVEIPHHPEPHTYRWSRLEEEAIKQYAAAAALNARREALEEAKQEAVNGRGCYGGIV